MLRILISGALLTFAVSSQVQAQELLDRYCTGCHNDKQRSGGVSLVGLTAEHSEQHAELWEKAIRQMRAGLMPPYKMPRPSSPEVQSFVLKVEAGLDKAAQMHPYRGHTGLRRLTRFEYVNAVRDLLGLKVDPAFLPADSPSHGFDNMAGDWTVSPALMEGYMRAAATISREATGDSGAQSSIRTYHIPASVTQRDHVEGTPFGTRGGMVLQHTFLADGDYQFRAAFYLTQHGALWGETLGPGEQLEIAVDGEQVALLDIDPELTVNNKILTTPKIHIKAGQRTVAASFVRRFDGPAPDTLEPVGHSLEDRAAGSTLGLTTLPHLKDFGIEGPEKITGLSDTPVRRRIFTCRPAHAADELPCAKQIISRLERAAFRRPVTDADLETPLQLFESEDKEEGFEAGIRTALQLILAHPQFVFRSEQFPENIPPSTSFRIDDLELANRLSFFLWSSIPDDQLIQLAAQGKLKDPVVLERQVRRMLADPRSSALAANFGGQWLGFRDMPDIQREGSVYPDFDENLAQSMERETELLLDSFFRENRSVGGLLNADFTFVDERLARHYGLPGVEGARFRRVTLTDSRRFGLLGQGSILMETSLANRTSPIVRGKWILEQLLGVTVPPPPPNVPALKTAGSGAEKAHTQRQLVEEHRANEPCASCHRMMDPFGFPLENFDAIGSWRINDGGAPIDSSSELYDGTKITGPVSLREALVNRSDMFERNFTEKLVMYALGRGTDYRDMPTIRAIEREAARDNYRFDSLVLAIVKSDAFQMNTSDPEPQADGKVH